MFIDLHVHTTASDGTLSPAEVLHMAQELGLGALSITDHDTVGGARKALDHGIPDGLAFVTGIEISAQRPRFLPGPGSLHILGYAIDLDDTRLNRTLKTAREARRNRNPRILQRLNELGLAVTPTDLAQEVEPGGQPGRPHIAQAMVRRGFARSIDDAFDRYLGAGKPAYVEKERIACADAIDTIRGAGGIAVLAHPGVIQTDQGALDAGAVSALGNMGIGGIEVYYPEHTPAQTALYADLAFRHGLRMTGGTDFHGALKPEIQLGTGLGDLQVPMALYHRLMTAVG